MNLLPRIIKEINFFNKDRIPGKRKEILQELIDYIIKKISLEEEIFLNFICTHNSRRSQMAQIWAQTAAGYYGIDITCFSGGVEVTAFNKRAVAAMKRAGFSIQKLNGGENPEYQVSYATDAEPLQCFSKLYDDKVNRADHFAAVMTCSDADANCPFIPGTEKRIAITYEDPKEFDDSPLEAEKYTERSVQIATEMFYVFSKINS